MRLGSRRFREDWVKWRNEAWSHSPPLLAALCALGLQGNCCLPHSALISSFILSFFSFSFIQVALRCLKRALKVHFLAHHIISSHWCLCMYWRRDEFRGAYRQTPSFILKNKGICVTVSIWCNKYPEKHVKFISFFCLPVTNSVTHYSYGNSYHVAFFHHFMDYYAAMHTKQRLCKDCAGPAALLVGLGLDTGSTAQQSLRLLEYFVLCISWVICIKFNQSNWNLLKDSQETLVDFFQNKIRFIDAIILYCAGDMDSNQKYIKTFYK